MKLGMILRSQDYSLERAKDRKKLIQELEKQIKKLDQERVEGYDIEIEEKITEKKSEFEELIQVKVRGAMIRSGSTWY